MRRARFITFLLLCAATCPVMAADVDELIRESRQLAQEKRYGEAHAKLERAQAMEPANDDVRLARAYLYYYEGAYDSAEEEFSGILTRHPGYADAQSGLESVRAAREGDGEFVWQADMGYEWSGFERSAQPDWNNQFLQLTRFFNGKSTAIHGRIERYDQFTNVDSYYQLGVSQRFTPRLTAYALAGFTPEANFRPRWRMKGGAELRLNELETAGMPLWLTLDAQHDEYRTTDVHNVTPGLRIEIADHWALSGKMIGVHEQGTKTVYGWTARLDGVIMPGLRFYTGYADAPETVAAVTVDTQTIFGGFAYDIDDARTLYLGYTHDDRERSYIRHAVNASVSLRF